MRVIRACHELGLEAVAVYSTADREGAWVRLADRAVCIGPPAGARQLSQPEQRDRRGRDDRLRRAAPGLRLPLGEPVVRAHVRGQRPDLHRPDRRVDGGARRQVARQGRDARRRDAARARLGGPARRASTRRGAWPARSAIRCCSRRPRAAAGAACGRSPSPPSSRPRTRRPPPRPGGVRRRRAVPREDRRRRPPRRGAGASATARAARSSSASASAACSAATRSCSRSRPRRSSATRRGRQLYDAALGAVRATQLPQRRHDRVPARRRPVVLLHGDEHAAPGRAPRQRGGHRHRPRARAAAARDGASRCRSRASPRRTATRSSSASTPRIRRAGSCRRPARCAASARRSAAACASTRTRYEGYTVPPNYDSLVAKLIVSDDDRHLRARARRAGARRVRGRGHRRRRCRSSARWSRASRLFRSGVYTTAYLEEAAGRLSSLSA